MKGKYLAVILAVFLLMGVVSGSVIYAARPDRTHDVALGDSVAVGQGATVEHRLALTHIGEGHIHRNNDGSDCRCVNCGLHRSVVPV